MDTYLDNNEIKKRFSWVGFCYFIFILDEIGSAFILGYTFKALGITKLNNSWLTYVVGLAPIWAFGFPVCYLLLRKVPDARPADASIKPKYLVQFYFMLTFMMIGGSIFSNIIASILKKTVGIIITNDTIDLIQKQQILPSILFTVLLGPFLEELAFRKVLLDRLSCYSKKYAILLSGIMFGLIHTNLHQFFYAALIGFVFAYIYTITGKLRYSVILHSTVNFIHGILPMIIIKNLDMAKIQSLSGKDTSDPAVMQEMMKLYADPFFILLLVYYLVLFGFIIAGIILFIINHKKIKVNDTQSPLQPPEAAKTAFLNIGTILFFIISIGYSIYEITKMN